MEANHPSTTGAITKTSRRTFGTITIGDKQQEYQLIKADGGKQRQVDASSHSSSGEVFFSGRSSINIKHNHS